MADEADVAAPPEHYNFAADVLARNAGRADKMAFIDDHTSLTYAHLHHRVCCFASALDGLGLRREDRMLVLMHDCVDWPVAFLGALFAGVVPVAVNTLLTADDYAYMLQHSRCRAAIVSAALVPVLREAMLAQTNDIETVIVAGDAAQEPLVLDALVAAHEPRAAPEDTLADDMAFWLYSSGSTGRPKGTVHAQASLYWTAELYGKAVLGLSEQDVCFSAAKLFFAYGLGNSLTFPLSVGATAVLMAGRPTPEAVFEKWSAYKPTVFFGAPTGYAAMLASPALPDAAEVTLRLCSSAGEALPEELGLRFRDHFGVDVYDGIGSTEMLHIFLSNAPGKLRYGSTGWPVAGYDIELRGEDDQPVVAGEVGELFIRGATAALMYWGNRAKSREVFRGEWTKSGDQYVQNDDGSYTYVGRSDDMFKVSGMYVSPFEVEGALVTHPAVLESAVVGLPDNDGLIKSKAFVVLKDGADAGEKALQTFVKERLAPYKYPRSIEFVSELPKTATGKIMRFRLRQ